MGLLRKLLTRIDDNLGDSDTHLVIASIPEQRKATSPDLLLSRQDVERVGTFACCECCTRYYKTPCTDLHRTPCDKDECSQFWPDGGAA